MLKGQRMFATVSCPRKIKWAQITLDSSHYRRTGIEVGAMVNIYQLCAVITLFVMHRGRDGGGEMT